MTPSAGEDETTADVPPLLSDEALDELQAGLERLARAHGRLRSLLDAVVTIGSALELDVVLHAITDSARKLVDARYAAIGVLDDRGEFIELITSGFGADQFRQQGDAQLPHGEGLLSELVRHPAPMRVEDLGSDPRSVGFPEGHPVMKTLLGVPIAVRRTIYGNLYLADKRHGGPFTDEDEEIVTALASAAGVAIENARLFEQLRRATEEFQRRLLPGLPDLPGLGLQARYEPSTRAPRIGGDWYDLIHLPGGIPCLMVGDVMGHGLESATLMSRISNALRVIAYQEQGPPSRVLGRLDELLHDIEGGAMATVVVARLEAPAADGSRPMRWALAGHVPPLLVTPDHRARYLDAEAGGHPLGVDPSLPRPDHEVTLPPGATVLLHTDGLIEQRGESLDEGMRTAAQVAARHATGPLGTLCDALLAERAGSLQDDIALLAARLHTP
ncbi:SpoIIE family protein phosphatase [Streptomyces sp. SBST2-5]|uniref:SpoIIE family protein phosphatase n=1 Tax=Streptomyces composti TaxID=2720025 RepID=A0ABX1A1D0_9ACTN|nr:GAF domain-containing SpoIIE family protein phosphatase [Streptomyces composti]NJP50195.1 SpoIIE family protein phosphatase [Streptomyces composti]